MFKVEGGVYKTADFEEIVGGTKEEYGPFKTYEEAEEVWSNKARFNVDNCCHRLFIRRI